MNDLFSSDTTTALAVYTDPSSRTLKSGSPDRMRSADLRHSFKLTARKRFQVAKQEHMQKEKKKREVLR